MNRKSILEVTEEEDPAKVYKVDLTNRNISHITSLKEFDKVRCLRLNFNYIDRIENLQYYPDLRELHLENNNIAKLGGVEGNKVLTVLNLRNNNIEKMQNIAHLIKLQTLNLDHNKVRKISGLQYLKDLKNLFVSHNCIESVQNLPAFSKLQNFRLSHNKIKNIPANLFASSKGLVFLDLSENRIETTTFLQNLSNLESLNLSNNRIREFQVGTMPNLEYLNVSHNQIESLPPAKTVFPQLVSMDVSYNMICSQIQILSTLAEVEYLAEFDCRQNPMFTQGFQSGLQKIHNFDFLNGKSFTKAGAKYYDKINLIQLDLTQNRHIYDEDDELDRKLKMSGFYDDELQFRMTGMNNRPSSPVKKMKNDDKETVYEKIDRDYKEFMDNDRKIRVIRQHYKKICGQYNITSQQLLTELPAQTTQSLAKKVEKQDKVKEEGSQKEMLSQNYISSQNQIKKQNQTNLTKWKELKQRQKSFNIRDVIKKSRGKDSSINNPINSQTGSNWQSGLKAGKLKSQLHRTQAIPKKVGEDLLRTIARPKSVRKKD